MDLFRQLPYDIQMKMFYFFEHPTAKIIKVYYFDCYGRAEPMRMLLSKANVEFEDVRLDDGAWNAFRTEHIASGKLEFGQVPAVELEDGTWLVQCRAIMNVLGDMYNLRPKDPNQIYKGEKAYTFLENDF